MPVNSDRRKELIQLVPDSAVISREWLMAKGLTRHAIDNLTKSGVLKSLAYGVYVREGGVPTWGDVVHFFQRIQKLDLTIGGVTALELQGLAHYIPVSGKKTIRLYGTDKLPNWANTIIEGVQFSKHAITELIGHSQTPEDAGMMMSYTKIYNWRDAKEGLRISTTERAILEVLTEVPRMTSFEHAAELIQGLTTLSPRRMQNLLVTCENFKIRRLFFYLAEKNNFSWLSKLDKAKIDMGKGKRVIEKNGTLDHQYLITVPK